MSRPLVLLLRARQSPDPYAAALEEAGFEVAFEPVLDFEFVNQDNLRRRFEQPDRYAGMVITSTRALDAVRETGAVDRWTSKPVYAVGPATAAEVRELGLSVRREGITRAAELAEAIVEDVPEGTLLFLCGNYRREVLPARLREAGIRLDELIVYRTHRIPPGHISKETSWVVFFSPSGVEAAERADAFPWNRIRTAAIGPTTAEALRRRSHPPSAVAGNPSPEGLVAALLGN